MKIALISSNFATTPYPVYPLGMSIICQSLKHAGHDAHMLDMLVHEQSLDACLTQLQEIQPNLVGISIRNIDNVNLLNEREFITIVKELVTQIHDQLQVPIVLGGAGYSLLPEIILQKTGADFGIVGEGEKQILELVNQLESDEPPAKGTVLRCGDHLVGSDMGRAYFDPQILEHYLGSGSIAAIQTKRGCTLRCTYCSYPYLEGGQVRSRPAVDVVDDIEKLINEKEISYLFFADSVFNDARDHYLDVLNEMKSRNVNVPWSAFLKPTGLTDEVVELMRETGLASAELGSDAATDQTLRGLNKPFRWKHVVDANDTLIRHDISVAHYFMCGGPEETPDTILEGIENIRNLNCSAAFVFMGIRILPDTTLYERAVQEGVIPADQDLLKAVYYLSPNVDRQWMEDQLTKGFASIPHVVFPPDAFDDKLQLLHKLGFAGSLWELMGIQGK